MSQRQVVLDTETTGLEVSRGHRVVEIGCIEMVERRPTGRHFHRYLNPDREIDAGAAEVTGLTMEFLADKPRFPAVADEFLEFVRDAELIIHNAEFDVGFLENELSLCNAPVTRLADCARITDTLAMARERYPGKRNSLDALCQRLAIDNAHRKLHGALLDAELLAEVYLAMTSGQGDLMLASSAGDTSMLPGRDTRASAMASAALRRASPDECVRHARMLERMERVGSTAIWRRYLAE
jgi:DNA polymerase-3 subunit epsilon